MSSSIPVYSGRGGKRVLVDVIKHGGKKKVKPVLLVDDKPVITGKRNKVRLLVDDKPVTIGKKITLTMKKKPLSGSWKTSLKNSVEKKHGSVESWKKKSVEEVLKEKKEEMEEEYGSLKKEAEELKEKRREEKREELEKQQLRVKKAEGEGEWGEMVLEQEALDNIEKEIDNV